MLIISGSFPLPDACDAENVNLDLGKQNPDGAMSQYGYRDSIKSYIMSSEISAKIGAESVSLHPPSLFGFTSKPKRSFPAADTAESDRWSLGPLCRPAAGDNVCGRIAECTTGTEDAE